MQSLGATLVAISAEPADIEKARAKTGVSFPLYADPDRSAIKAWGTHDADNDISLPATFVVDTEGMVVFRHVGKDQTDRPPQSSILDALRALQPD